MEILKEIQNLCEGIQYSRDIPEQAKKLAKENNVVVIAGGSDDLMYCYGAKCYLTEYCEHSYGWDGDDLTDTGESQLDLEALQLGLKIWWCGCIEDKGLKIEGYDIEKSGAFSYSVDDSIKALDFLVMEDSEVYCTGKIIQLPSDFTSSV